MTTETLSIRRGENGEVIPIQIKNGSGNVVITGAVPSESTIVFKDPNDLDTTVLTLTDSDFAIVSPNINWTPTDAHLVLLTKNNYVGFVHLINGPRETIAKFFLYIEET